MSIEVIFFLSELVVNLIEENLLNVSVIVGFVVGGFFVVIMIFVVVCCKVMCKCWKVIVEDGVV